MLTLLTSLTTGPVLETREGVRARIRLLSVGELMLLCTQYDCEPAGLEVILHRPRRRRRKRKEEQLSLF